MLRTGGLAALVLAAVPLATSAQNGAPLFDAPEPLPLTLTADFGVLLKDRKQDNPYRPGKLTFPGADGQRATVDVRVRTRGFFRLRPSTCSFPPLTLNLPRRRVEGTVLAGQNRLKLVTHCRETGEFEQNVLQEYLIYRMLNLLTDRSYRVRLARLTYVDQAGKRDTVTRFGFLIEDDSLMAARHGAQAVEIQGAMQDDTEQEHMVLVALFQYMIGNTDWAIRVLHNITLTRDTANRWFAIPYDFDWSGIIAPHYAHPDPRLGIRSVRERVYRGFCRPEAEIQAALSLFRERKEAIYALYRSQAGLSPKNAERARAYLDGFYKIITDPGAVRREIVRACRQG